MSAPPPSVLVTKHIILSVTCHGSLGTCPLPELGLFQGEDGRGHFLSTYYVSDTSVCFTG